jgi:glycosyltransferase involved in cell wall biosynthesis
MRNRPLPAARLAAPVPPIDRALTVPGGNPERASTAPRAEALAHSLPLIAGKGTPWSGLEERGAGLWVENDAQSLARAIEKVAALPLPEMGARGRAWVKEAFS